MSQPRTGVPDLWRRISHRMHERFRPIFKDIDLPPMSMVVFKHIAQEPGVTVSELARRSHTVKSHVSKLIDHLVRLGFLEKRVDPADQRLVRIYMTDAAVNMKQAMEDRIYTAWAEVEADLNEAEHEQVLTGLRILLNALEKPRNANPDNSESTN